MASEKPSEQFCLWFNPYIADQGIVSRYFTTEPDHTVKVIDDEKKAVMKRLRDTVTVNFICQKEG